MKHNVSNLIPKSEGNNITAKDMLETVEIMNFIEFAESVSWQVFGQVKEVSN
jgi:hypothetical protein